MTRYWTSRGRLGWAFVVTLFAAHSASAAPPSVTNVSLRGLKIGSTTTITIDGANLLPNSVIVLSAPIANQELKPGGSATRVQFDVTLDGSIPPGIQSLRVANAQGISNPLAVAVDDLPQQAFAAEVPNLPIAMSGNLTGAQILRTSFAGKKGQSIVVDVEGQRLGSKLRPVLRLYDSRGTQLAWSPPTASIAGDARCATVLPDDSQYVVEMHDLLYRGAGPGFFRLKIGELKYADMVIPAGVARGEKATVEFVSSNLPKETRATWDVPADLAPASYPSPGAETLTGGRPRLFVSDHPEIVETMPGDANLQEVPLSPVGINGRISAAGQEDRYLLAVTPGLRLRVDVWAKRIGSPLDGVLTLRGEQGNQLARNDDRPGMSDPGLDYTVPGNVNKIVVSIADLQQRGGDEFIYRIDVRDLARPDFALTFNGDRVNVPAGGSQVVEVTAVRSGYNGPIKLELPGLPADVQVSGDVIAAGSTIGLLTLSAPTGAPSAKLLTIVGRGVDTAASLVRVAQSAASTVSEDRPWLSREFGYASTTPAPIGIVWNPVAEEKLILGSNLPANIKLTRAENTSGPIRVRLLTTQVMPRKTIKQDNKDVEVDDVDRALRLTGATEFAADTQDANVNIAIPADLPQHEWGLVLVAELLTADKKSVVAATTTPARMFSTTQALRLELSSAADVEAKAGGGETGKFTGKVLRMDGFHQPATVTIVGLPAEYPAPSVVVPADQTDFELPVRFVYEAKAAELKDMKLVASIRTDPNDADSIVNSNSINVNVKVVAGEKPEGQ